MAETPQSHGKRKTAAARITLAPGSGRIQINNERSLDDFFPRETHRRSVLSPLVLTDRLSSYDVQVRVRRGARAVRVHLEALLDRRQHQTAVAHAALGDHVVGSKCRP